MSTMEIPGQAEAKSIDILPIHTHSASLHYRSDVNAVLLFVLLLFEKSTWEPIRNFHHFTSLR